jgi:asparagine synthase (glutamine-hydrolysing)
MCGIAGIFNLKSGIEIDTIQFHQSLDKMAHRGPNARAVERINSDLLLGHLRLSIIDLKEESNQPFQLDKEYWIVFNGEIYNYLELRDELKNSGYTFRTDSDTEVLLRAYQHWGEDCVKRFNGMWAFAIYDVIKNVLFCSRDRFGVKPFNYSLFNDQFIFASEIKFILSFYPELRKPNYNVISNFCRTSIGAQIDETWFEQIYRLQPASNLVIHNGNIKIYKYWDYPRKVNRNITFDNAIKKYKELFFDAIKLRMRSDVPVGFTLSSGIDSTSLVYSINRNSNIKTYTAAFNPSKFEKTEKSNFKTDVQIDEASIVKSVANDVGMDANIINISYENYTNNLAKIIYYLESGHGSPAVYPLFQVLEFAKKDITVVLEGQGADELLGGYISNVTPIYLIHLLKKFQFRKAYSVFRHFNSVYSLKSMLLLFIRNLNISVIDKIYFLFSGKQQLFIGPLKTFTKIKDYPVQPIDFDDSLNEHLFKSHSGGLVNLLHYGDAISMANSIESRLPFMDYRLVEFVFTLPPEFKIHNGYGKYIHRVAMEGVVPEKILKSPYKFGFDSPLSNLYSDDSKDSPKSILLSERSLKRGLFSENVLRKYFDEQINGLSDNSRLLYRILSVELWFREFIDNY